MPRSKTAAATGNARRNASSHPPAHSTCMTKPSAQRGVAEGARSRDGSFAAWGSAMSAELIPSFWLPPAAGRRECIKIVDHPSDEADRLGKGRNAAILLHRLLAGVVGGEDEKRVVISFVQRTQEANAAPHIVGRIA